MRRFLDRFWFVEAPPEPLAWVRVLVGAYSLVYLGSRFGQFLAIGRTDASFFEPVGAVAFLHAPLPPGVWRALLTATIAANVLFLAGWMHRLTGPVFAALLLACLSYRNSWSMIYHTHTLLVLQAIVLGAAPAADALSVDAVLRRRRGEAPPAASWRYGWGLRLMCAVVVATYGLAGVVKVMSPLGWSWAKGESLRAQIAMDALRKELLGSDPSPLAYSLYDQVGLFTALGVFTLVVELGAPLALLGRVPGLAWALTAYAMHWGVLLLMRIDFEYSLWGLPFLPFLPLDRVSGWAARRFGRRAAGIPEKSRLPSGSPEPQYGTMGTNDRGTA